MTRRSPSGRLITPSKHDAAPTGTFPRVGSFVLPDPGCCPGLAGDHGAFILEPAPGPEEDA